ncbi:MAG: beta-ketoacyl-ACP synthase II [Puniceicoccales bacterium]|jgi:3-oxoacyl-[acyl-carrier-protein] synthase II|nr:beta-ketoacyl-ACP synthase II [Puniceicoccales bacterium]
MAKTHLHRVVVTGLGAISPLALNFEASWEALLAGSCGVGLVTKIEGIERFPCRVAGELKGFNPTDYLDPKEVRRNDPFTHYAVAAARMACADGAVDLDRCDRNRVGVLIGSGVGGLQTIENQSKVLHGGNPRMVSPFTIPALIPDMASGIVAIEFGVHGPNFAAVSACTTGAHAIGEAYHFLQLGKADIIFSGGTEGGINAFGFAAFCAMRAMATGYNDDPARASRPFDRKRNGFVMGEGAGVLVLETLENALSRGARIYCELVAYSAGCDASHITAPDLSGEKLAVVLCNALKEAQVAPEEVDYVNAHGTSTSYNDLCETNAYKLVFGKRAKELTISSIKGATGHMLGAAGAFEAAVCAKAITTGKIPPTINYEFPDPACDLDYTANKMREKKVRVALSDNLGFGGHNVALIFRELEP